MANQPKPIPMKKTYQPTSGTPAGKKGVPDFKIGDKALKC